MLLCSLPLCSSCNLTGPCIQKLELRNSEDNGNAEFERREAWSSIVTVIQFATYMLHERVLEPNSFLRWGFLFQVIFVLKFYK